MNQNQMFLEALTRDRVAELRRGTGAAGRLEPRRTRAHGVRRAAGWLLVDVGLRLAAPGGTTRHQLARGQR